MPSDRCRSVCLSCPVCDVGVLWPNGWTDQDEPYHAGRPRPWPNRVTWGPSSPSPRERGTAVPPPRLFGPCLLWLRSPISAAAELLLPHASKVLFFQRAPHCKRCINYSNSVCLSVRPSHAGIVSKRRHVARCSLHRWIAKCV